MLVVDDDRHVVRLIRVNLERAGYEVMTAANGHDSVALAAEEDFDLIVLDVMMPGMDGYDACRRIREFSQVPIVFLTAKGEHSDKIRGFDLGGDDFLTKPFNPEELLARVKAVLRRTQMGADVKPQPIVTCGNLRLDFARHKVQMNGRDVKLSPTEYKLLYHLATNIERVLRHEDLLQMVWGPEYRDETEYLWVYVRYLRQKLEDDPSHPRYIISEPGVGYVLRIPEEQTNGERYAG
jgi:two-component system KDP operon response regulator KdpE